MRYTTQPCRKLWKQWTWFELLTPAECIVVWFPISPCYCLDWVCVNASLLATCLDVLWGCIKVVRTCPPTGRGSCRATAQTAACGRSCGEPSWCYAVAGGDWTVASVLWHPMCANKHMKNTWQMNKKNNIIWTHKKAKSMVQTLKRRGILEINEISEYLNLLKILTRCSC